MGQKKRKRTAIHKLTEFDRMALGLAFEDTRKRIHEKNDEKEDRNFKKLVQKGVIVKEPPADRGRTR